MNDPVASPAAGGPQRPLAAVMPNSEWKLQAGSSVQETLVSWAGRAGWSVLWDLDSDFEARAGAVFTGAFTQAVTELVNAIPSSTGLRVELRSGNNPPLVYVHRERIERPR